jgi:hypothetical protein
MASAPFSGLSLGRGVGTLSGEKELAEVFDTQGYTRRPWPPCGSFHTFLASPQ